MKNISKWSKQAAEGQAVDEEDMDIQAADFHCDIVSEASKDAN